MLGLLIFTSYFPKTTPGTSISHKYWTH